MSNNKSAKISKKSTTKLFCDRCHRTSHLSSNCYANTTIEGTILEKDLPLETDVHIWKDIPLESDVPLEKDVPLEIDIPIETDIQLKTDVPINIAIPIETGISINTDIPIEKTIQINIGITIDTSIPIKQDIPIVTKDDTSKCNCINSYMFPHRKNKCALKKIF